MPPDLIALFLLAGASSAVTIATVAASARARKPPSAWRREPLRVGHQAIRQGISFPLPTLSVLPPLAVTLSATQGTANALRLL